VEKVKILLKETKNGCSLFANQIIEVDEKILEFEKNFISYSTNKTLRISENVHQISRDPEALENFINHSCKPNTYIDFQNLFLISSKKIEYGEEITYDYFTSDWDNEDVFDCQCGTSNCRQKINGFKHLSDEERLKIKNKLSPFLLNKF
jgi:hypothetical protein